MGKVPLKEVVFNQPTQIPGCSVSMTTVVPMEERLVGGQPFYCPQPYYDDESDKIIIEDREYPMARVHHFTRAKAAKSKPATTDLTRFTIGKRAPRRLQISVDDISDLGPVTKKTGPKD